MGRYDPPDPLCRHVPSVRVSSHIGMPEHPQEAYASTYCCHREACQLDAGEWVRAVTHQDVVHVIPFVRQPARQT